MKTNKILCSNKYPFKEHIENFAKKINDCEFEIFENIIECVNYVEKNFSNYNRIVIIDEDGVYPFLYLTKIKGLVASTVYDEHSAYMTPFHNNTTVISIGFEICGEDLIKSIINYFFNTKFEGGRHYARIDMLKKELEAE